MLNRRSNLALITVLAGSSCIASVHDVRAAEGITHQLIEASDGEKSFVCGDFNGDGHTDLIVAEESADRIAVFLNDGSGMLIRDADYPAGEEPSWLCALDFNKDGHPDVAVANHEVDSVTLLRGSETAQFVAAKSSPIPLDTEPHSHVIKAVDMDGDRITDLVLDNRDRSGVFLLRGNATGGFDTPGRNFDVGGAPYLGFAVTDLNNDGKPDIVTPNQNDLSVMLNRSSTQIAFERVVSIPFRSPFAVGAGDFNGDDNVDLVVASERQTPGVVAFAGDGGGDFERMASTSIAQGAKMVATGDINANGIADAVITSWNSDIVMLIGSAKGPSFIPLPRRGIENPWGVALADFNNDGRDEIVVGDAASGRVHIYAVAETDD